ncbi:hypothetical protein HSR121_1646 [Halapricum desulfuricans]|uniref:Uncharacterized protein n=1 Tax=Halapricum desulfuricans TaxID=2841257 RepID=A0A897N3X8_9EURY|nr:hypothetical protein HSR121_1646 [Halapricum desulfuricans]
MGKNASLRRILITPGAVAPNAASSAIPAQAVSPLADRYGGHAAIDRTVTSSTIRGSEPVHGP